LADGDRGRFIASPTNTLVPCNGNATTNPNGAIVVNFAPNIPAFGNDRNNAYGFIRFRAKVN
jgi:hypothetical protein